jgi:hypothetical protein
MFWLRIGTSGVGGSFKHGNDPSGSIQCVEFFD